MGEHLKLDIKLQIGNPALPININAMFKLEIEQIPRGIDQVFVLNCKCN